MGKIIWISDTHFVAEGLVQGHDPRARLDAAITFVNQHHSDADFCVISGDMVERATDTDYRALADRLEKLRIPILPMVGNHDRRALLRAHLPLPRTCMADFIQYNVPISGAQLICLDTLIEGSDAGVLCPERLRWLHDELSRAPKTPHILFMHHPPMALGLPMQDTDRLENGADFLDLIAEAPQVRQLLIGHVHRPITGHVRGIPFTTLRSALFQAPPPVPPWDWSSFSPAAEAPELGVISITAEGITIQMQQFCPYAIGTA